MLAGTETLATIANHWLARFEHALSQKNTQSLANLFHPDSHWRDVLALTWRIDTVSGGARVTMHPWASEATARPSSRSSPPTRASSE